MASADRLEVMLGTFEGRWVFPVLHEGGSPTHPTWFHIALLLLRPDGILP